LIMQWAVITKTVLNIPGMGRLAVDAILTCAYRAVQGVMPVCAAAPIGAKLPDDPSYAPFHPWLKP
jgi:peptide/nickel transport system permease protein